MKQICAAFFLVYLMATCVIAAEQEELAQAQADLSTIEVLDLETAQRVALTGNPDMAAAMSRVEQARARVNQALAAWWPSLDLSWSGSRTRQSDSVYEQNQALANLYGRSIDRTTDQSSAGLQATWTLFDGFFRSFSQQQAEYNELTVAAARKDSQRLLVNAVAEAFLNAQLAQTNVDIARADETFYLSQLRDAQAGYGLAALLGVPDASFPQELRLAELDKDFTVSEMKEDPQTLINEALAVRPDIQQLEMLKKESEAGSGQAEAPFYPKVQLVGAVNGARQGDVAITGDDLGNMVGINVAWNLFSGGADKARLFEAQQKEREVAYNLASLRNNVAAEVRQDLALLAAAEEQVRLQRESVELVKENRELAKNEYEAGEASLVRLNEAQRDLNTTFSRLAQALVGYHQARHQLLSATGRNLQSFATEAQ